MTSKIISSKTKLISKPKENTFNQKLHFSSSSNEWYTPQKIINPTVNLLGRIDLDPCSNCKYYPNIPAKEHFILADNGLNKNWSGKVFLNPPYGREIKVWIEKLVYHYNKDDINEAVALLPSRTGTKWFALLRKFPRCFISGRLHFSGKPHPAPFPSVIVYLGKDNMRFKQHFESLGDLYELM